MQAFEKGWLDGSISEIQTIGNRFVGKKAAHLDAEDTEAYEIVFTDVPA